MEEFRENGISKWLKLRRWQVAIFELCMLSGWALFTLYLPEFFISIERLLRMLLLVPSLYICHINYKQANVPESESEKDK